MNLEDILNFSRLQCTGDVARAGWVLDQDAIIEAIDLLEIELPVRIRFMTGKYTLGTHRAHQDTHRITLDQTLDIKHSNFCLWHELVHARQAEQWSKKSGWPIRKFYYNAYRKAKGPHGMSYEGNYYEIEANRIAAQNEHMQLVAKAV